MRLNKIGDKLMMLAACGLALATGLSGCGGGGGGSSSDSRVSTTSNGSGCDSRAFTPNYAGENDPHTGQANVLRHWSAFPVTVYFQNSDLLTAERKSSALAGFDWWGKATGGLVSYQVTDNAATANIVVTFEQSGETEYGALTTDTFDGNTLTHATITFNIAYLTTDALLTPAAAHEFGHALGIDGHSNDLSDVMAYSASVYNLKQLSTRDINTMKTDYGCSGAGRASGMAIQGLRTTTQP